MYIIQFPYGVICYCDDNNEWYYIIRKHRSRILLIDAWRAHRDLTRTHFFRWTVKCRTTSAVYPLVPTCCCSRARNSLINRKTTSRYNTIEFDGMPRFEMYQTITYFLTVFVVIVVVNGQTFGRCPKKDTMKTFDPKEVSWILPNNIGLIFNLIFPFIRPLPKFGVGDRDAMERSTFSF